MHLELIIPCSAKYWKICFQHGQRINPERLGLTYTHCYIFKIDNQQRPTNSTGNSAEYSVKSKWEKSLQNN